MEGNKIPRKGSLGITRFDLLVINKIVLAPYVGASLEIMKRDSLKMRRNRLFVFTIDKIYKANLFRFALFNIKIFY